MERKHIRIALTGKARAGKDTVFSILARSIIKQTEDAEVLPNIKQFAFGDDLKMYAEALFPEQFTDGKKPRELFQNFGQDMRGYNPDIWVNKVAQKVKQHGASDGIKVSFITDLRQPNEYQYCRDNGFYIIKIVAPEDIRLSRMSSEGDSFSQKSLSHETELHIDTYDTDYTVHNQFNNLDSLEFKVEQIAKDILIKENINNKLKETV